MERNQSLINIFASLLMIVLIAFVIKVVIQKDGLNINSAELSERDSYKFINKSVNGENKTVRYGKSGYEDGNANIVSSIVVNYRMFDTLGEIIVLFASTAGVGLLLSFKKQKKHTEASSITKTAISIISLIAVVTGTVIIIHGHLTPGGGFPGGAIIASGLLLTLLIFKNKIKNRIFLVLETLTGLLILGIGIAGIFISGSFFQNFLPAGQIGNLFSGGTVAVLYILIGIKVASEIISIGIYFLKTDEIDGEKA